MKKDESRSDEGMKRGEVLCSIARNMAWKYKMYYFVKKNTKKPKKTQTLWEQLENF